MDPINLTLLHKYFSGECSKAEEQLVQEWLKADARNREYLKSLEKIWNASFGDEFDVDVQAAWKKFRERVFEEQKAEAKPRNVFSIVDKTHSRYEYEHPRRQWLAVGAYAAAVIVVVAVAVVLFSPFTHKVTPPPTAMKKIVTQKGYRTSLELADGSRVVLNAESRLTVPKEFAADKRVVYLVGQAYFEVVHNPDKPFIVHAGDVSTRVLGTKFGIRAYPAEKKVQVVVAEGRVAVDSQKPTGRREEIQLTHNQMGVVSQNGQTKVTSVANLDQYLGWRKGRLVFRNTLFPAVRRQLERWYDITCKLAPDSYELNSLRLTATFDNEPLSEVLKVIALSLNLDYRRVHQVVIFSKKEKKQDEHSL